MTALLEHCVSNTKEQWKRAPEPVKTVPVIFDLATLKNYRSDFMLRRLWESITQQVLDPYVQGASSPPRPQILEFKRDSDAWQIFGAAANDLWEKLAGTKGWCHWALIIEHADMLLSGETQAWLAPLLQMLKSKENWAPSCLVLSGGRRLRDEVAKRSSPLHFLRPYFLEVFIDDEVIGLLEDPALAADVVALSGKHPSVMPWLMQALGTHGDVDTAVAAIRPQVDALFTRILGQFSRPPKHQYTAPQPLIDHQLMRELINYGGICELGQLERQMGMGTLRAAADFLLAMGVAEQVTAQNKLCLKAGFGLWNQWYMAQSAPKA